MEIKSVKICGVPHTIKEVEDKFDVDMHFGQINYSKAEILVNEGITEELKKETIFHEILHGMLVHIGRQDLSNDESLVQALSNAMYQTFDIKTNYEVSKKKEGDCEDCKYASLKDYEEPCNSCQNAYVYKFVRRGEE